MAVSTPILGARLQRRERKNRANGASGQIGRRSGGFLVTYSTLYSYRHQDINHYSPNEAALQGQLEVFDVEGLSRFDLVVHVRNRLSANEL